MKKRLYTDKEIEILKSMYADNLTEKIAKIINRDVKSVYRKANSLGLKKSKEFWKKEESGRFLGLHGKEFWFKKGHKPFNTGMKQDEYMDKETIERTKATRFKKGSVPHNTKYDGYESVRGDGYLYIRLSKGVHVLKHRVIWQSVYGPIPEGMNIIFKDGNKLNCDIENLSMLSDSQLMERNSIQNYPKEYITAFKALSKLNKTINSYGEK